MRTFKNAPGVFYAIASGAAANSTTLCYASEIRTGRQFYLTSTWLHEELRKDEKRGRPCEIKITVRKKGIFFAKLLVFDETSTQLLGDFREPIGGSDFFDVISEAY